MNDDVKQDFRPKQLRTEPYKRSPIGASGGVGGSGDTFMGRGGGRDSGSIFMGGGGAANYTGETTQLGGIDDEPTLDPILAKVEAMLNQNRLRDTAKLVASELNWKEVMTIARFIADKLTPDEGKPNAHDIAEALVEWGDTQLLGSTKTTTDSDPGSPSKPKETI
jgi:hypothetical protein